MSESIHPNTMSKIRQLDAIGYNQKQIAKVCCVSESAVYKYIKMSNQEYLEERQRYYQNARSQKGKTNMIGSKDQLCWHCQNACGNCTWSKSLEPVEGWKAEQTYIPEPRGNDKVMTRGYLVLECPEFKRNKSEV